MLTFNLCPVAFVSFCLSLPAKSTRFNWEVLICSTAPFLSCQKTRVKFYSDCLQITFKQFEYFQHKANWHERENLLGSTRDLQNYCISKQQKVQIDLLLLAVSPKASQLGTHKVWKQMIQNIR